MNVFGLFYSCLECFSVLFGYSTFQFVGLIDVVLRSEDVVACLYFSLILYYCFYQRKNGRTCNAQVPLKLCTK